MAITTTNARYEGFIFDGENSRTYGVYVTDVEVFGAPVRNVEMISIPGRNGSFALDKGSYENIQVTYKCAMGCESQADFNAGISAFRNMLASRTGYKRLEDEINTSEYRMACFRGGISVPTINKSTATFDVVFDCKPQRYLKSGETAVSVASGGTISNPTLYDASPLLEIAGTGEIFLNSSKITVSNNPIGMVTLAVESTSHADDLQRTVDTSMLATGDPITIQDGTYYSVRYTHKTERVTAVSNLSMTGDLTGSVAYVIDGGHFLYINATFDAIDFTNGTAATYTNTITFTATIQNPGGTTTATGTITITISYDGANTFYFPRVTAPNISAMASSLANYRRKAIVGDSSVIPVTGVMYFDLDIGEAYTVVGGSIVSVNDSVSFGAKLPVLVPGSNTITYDNTITQFKIVPRWWQL